MSQHFMESNISLLHAQQLSSHSCPDHLILLDLIILIVLAEDRNYEVPRYAVFSAAVTVIRPAGPVSNCSQQTNHI
jgi:hypothetical protein